MSANSNVSAVFDEPRSVCRPNYVQCSAVLSVMLNKDLWPKVKVKLSICQSQLQNNDHTVMMTMMNKILVKQENSDSY